jgi:endoribonuclease L-PSP
MRVGNLVFMSGQIALDPASGEMVQDSFAAETRRVFDNLAAVATAAGGGLAQIVKLNLYLTDLAHFAAVNEIMAEYFQAPFPARAAVGVASLPRGARVEAEAVLALD